MPNILIEENKVYGIDCTSAIWATDEIHDVYHRAGVQLKDVDFVIEDEEKLYLVEYKNANISGAANPNAFKPLEDKARISVVQKFYDSLHYLTLRNKTKSRDYIYIVEGPKIDRTMRKKLRNSLKNALPFALQDQISNNAELIQEVAVLSIDEWNAHRVYGRFPVVKL